MSAHKHKPLKEKWHGPNIHNYFHSNLTHNFTLILFKTLDEFQGITTLVTSIYAFHPPTNEK